MRVCHALAGNLYSLGLAVDSRIVRTGLKVWRCSGCGEDVVDELDAFRCGQEWTVLGVLVEMPHEGVKAGVGDADALGRDVPRPEENCRGVFLPKMRKGEPWSPPQADVVRPVPKSSVDAFSVFEGKLSVGPCDALRDRNTCYHSDRSTERCPENSAPTAPDDGSRHPGRNFRAPNHPSDT